MDKAFIELRFFRDINDFQRHYILQKIGMIPEGKASVQLEIQRMILKAAFKKGLTCSVGSMIDRLTK